MKCMYEGTKELFGTRGGPQYDGELQEGTVAIE